MKSDLLFCFGHKKGKSMVLEKIAPVTLYLKRPFSPVTHYKKSNGSKSLLSLFT